MKNLFTVAAKSLMIIAAVLIVSTIHAQVNSFGTVPKKYTPGHVTITIPDQWKESIIREDNNEISTFSLNNGDAPPVFLFSVTQIPEQQWVKAKAQLTDVKMIAQKDGIIYYSQKNNKDKIKGANRDLYQQIYPHLDELINSIQID